MPATPAGETRTVDVAAVEPFTGTYMNDALGSVRLEIENGALYLDIGEVRMMLRASPVASPVR